MAPRGVVPTGSIPPAVAPAVALRKSSIAVLLYGMDIVFVIIADLLQGQFPHKG